jgi:hypothetical protein
MKSVIRIIAPHFEANCDKDHRVSNLSDIAEHIRDTYKQIADSTIRSYYHLWRRNKACFCGRVYP